MSQFCKENNIIYEFTTPYTFKPNEVTEREKIILIDMVNSMLLSSRVHENL